MSFQQEDKVKSETGFGELFARLWPHFMKHKGLFVSTMIAVLALTAVARVIPSVFGYAVDHGLEKKDTNVIAWCAGVFLAMEVLRMLFQFLHSYLFARMGNRILFEIRSELIDHVEHLPLKYFDRNPSGRIVTRITNDVVSLGELFTQGIISVFANFLSLISIAIAMCLIDLKMGLITILIAPVLGWIGHRLSEAIRITLRESKRRMAMINSFVAENIAGMRILQLFSQIDRNFNRFEKLSAEYKKAQMASVHLYGLLWPTVNFFNAVSIAIALYLAAGALQLGALTTGAVVAFILHVRDFTQPLRIILEKYQIFQNSLSGAERIFTVLDEPLEPNGSTATGVSEYPVEFRDVGFRYADDLPLVLERFNLKVRKGESVAIVGRTGSGKSTIISLLQGFYPLEAGQIYLHGTDLNAIDKGNLRRHVGVVMQENFLFRGTIADNIGLMADDISMQTIEKAALQAGCGSLLAKHPEGLLARVEERGANLSQGERQLIAFARVLAFDPDILVLDEATSNIDSQSEQQIQNAIAQTRQGRTSIFIAHRLSTIANCDRIIVLDKGQIVESGTYMQLLAKRGLFATMHEAQS